MVRDKRRVANLLFGADMQTAAAPRGYKQPWPGDAVVKLCNLPQPLHKQGVIAAVLQAAGTMQKCG